MPSIARSFGPLLLLGACTSYAARPLEPDASAQAFVARTLTSKALHDWFAAHARPWPEAAWTFDDLWLAALHEDAELAAARAKVEVAAAAVQQAAERPNPQLAFGPEFSTNPDPGTSPWVLGVSLNFPIELGDKRAVQRHLAERQHAAASLAAAETLWQARERLQSAHLVLQFARQRAALADREEQLAAQLATQAERRFAAGATAAADREEVRLLHIAAKQAAAAAHAATESAQHELAQAIGVPSAALAAIVLDPSVVAPDPGTHGAAELRRGALQHRSDIQQQLVAYAIAEDTLRLEVEKQYPDLQLGPGYQFDQGQNKILFGVAFELPLFHHNEGAIAVATAARAAAEQTFLAVQAHAIGSCEALAAAHAAAQRDLIAATDQLAGRHAATNRVERRFALGLDDAVAVTQAQRAELTAEREVLAARLTAAAAAIALEQALGVPFAVLDQDQTATRPTPEARR